MTPTTTLRSEARLKVIDSVAECADYEHRKTYHKLHVYRDGDVRWTQHLSKSDDIIDSGAARFQAVPSVACVGTGSQCCNCDYCHDVYYPEAEALAIEQGRKYDKDSKYADDDAAIADAVANSDLSDMEADMLEHFDTIPAGYFGDEI